MSALPLEPLLLFGRFTSPTASEDERWAAVLARVIWRALTRRFLSLGNARHCAQPTRKADCNLHSTEDVDLVLESCFAPVGVRVKRKQDCHTRKTSGPNAGDSTR